MAKKPTLAQRRANHTKNMRPDQRKNNMVQHKKLTAKTRAVIGFSKDRNKNKRKK